MATIKLMKHLVVLVLVMIFATAYAQQGSDYPQRQVRLVVPFPPAGSTDILARLLSKEMFPNTHVRPIVENVPGAGGNLGAAVVARAAPDGYTVEVGAMSTHAMNGLLYKKIAYDPMKDFQPVAMLASVVNVIAVSNALPVKTFGELLAYIRNNPGKLAYSSGGIGSHNHLTLAYLARTAGLDLLHVPYKGGAPAVTALLQGEVQMFAGGLSLLSQHSKAGKIRLIAVTERERSGLLPGVPAVAEHIPNFEVSNWYGLFAPRGIDRTIVNRVSQEVNRIMTTPAMKAQLSEYGMTYVYASSEQLEKMLEQEHAKWSGFITKWNITAE